MNFDMSFEQTRSQNPNFYVRTCCPACGSHQNFPIYSCEFDQPPVSTFLLQSYPNAELSLVKGAQFRVNKCSECGTLFQAEVGRETFLDALYGEWVWDTDDPESDIPGYRFHITHPRLVRDGHEIMAVAAYLGLKASDLVTLDFGMGWGLWARIAAQLGCRSHGTDLSARRTEFVASKGVTTLTLEQLGGLRTHFVNAEQVFEHLSEPAEVLAALVEALRPGGILKISVPGSNGAEKALHSISKGAAMVRDSIVAIAPLEHVNCYSREGLEKLGGKFGLKEVKPSPLTGFAFLWQRGVSLRYPKLLLKELLRPLYQHNNRRNTYVWLRKSG